MRYYGRWAGNERGTPEDKTRCVEIVFPRGSMISHQCGRKRGHGDGGLFCAAHAKKTRHWVPKDEGGDER